MHAFTSRVFFLNSFEIEIKFALRNKLICGIAWSYSIFQELKIVWQNAIDWYIVLRSKWHTQETGWTKCTCMVLYAKFMDRNSRDCDFFSSTNPSLTHAYMVNIPKSIKWIKSRGEMPAATVTTIQTKWTDRVAQNLMSPAIMNAPCDYCYLIKYMRCVWRPRWC